MIQRIQTLLLLLAAISAFLISNLNFATITSSVNIFNVNGILTTDKGDFVHHYNIISIVTLSLSSLVAFIIIFLYKNRVLQIRIARFLFLLYTAFIAVAFLIPDFKPEMDDIISTEVGIGAYLSFIPALLTLVAIRYIKRDEELVRAANRIR